MKTSEKSHAKTIFIVSAILILVCVTSFVLPFSLYFHSSIWKYNVEDFEEFEGDFSSVAAFCSEFITRKINENPSCNNWFSYSNKNLYYRADLISVPSDIQSSLIKINAAFKHKDAKLEVIRCYGENVYFCTHNGQYSLVYSPDGKPTSVCGLKKQDVYVREISNGWFHVVKNNH